jgi:hypothetical protein
MNRLDERIVIRLTAADKATLVAVAKANDRTPAQEVRRALHIYLISVTREGAA